MLSTLLWLPVVIVALAGLVRLLEASDRRWDRISRRRHTRRRFRRERRAATREPVDALVIRHLRGAR